MGQSSSTEQDVSLELREVQSLAASTGALPSLEKAFSLLSDPQTKSIPLHSLQKCFELSFGNLESDHDVVSKELPLFFSHLGSTIVDLYFVSNKDGVSWIEFLKGYTKCCARTVASTSFVNLFRVFSTTCSKAGIPVNLQFEEYDDDCKISGMLSPKDMITLLLICWIFAWDGRRMKLNIVNTKSEFSFPDVSHLVASAIVSCSEDAEKLDFSDSVVTDLDIQLPAAGIHSWGLKTVPNLADCFVQFIHARLCYLATREDKIEVPTCSSAHESLPSDSKLLTCGRAWAISLTLRNPIQEELSQICFPIAGHDDEEEGTDFLLYQSSVNGKGMNRFWSNVEGYNGPTLMIISACEEKSANRWIIGALTGQGFENKDVFYGTSGSLYALCPVFNPIPSFGREKNFVYSHLHPTGYEPHPKPVGIAFGGAAGNERIFMDEDFAKVTLRHHAVDKTYQHVPLFLNQGFLPVEATVFGVEVWGLGGKNASTKQSSYKKREQLFSDQRRKIDLAKFSNWEDSPEKMMMDMMSNPNAVGREER